jgi:hypothetical protein
MSNLRDAADYELKQIRAMLSRWTPDTQSESNDASLKNEIQDRISAASSLFDTLSSLEDSESIGFVSEFRSLRGRFEAGDTVPPSLSQIRQSPSQPEVSQPNEIVIPRPRSRTPRTITGDVCWAFGYAVLICILFAIIWTQYAKTH